MDLLRQKRCGAFFTPEPVVRTLVSWAVRNPDERMLDPSCGDGRFLACHRNSVGIEQDADEARAAIERAPGALVHEGDFFAWAANTEERFDCAAGNPPFIRYQVFNGETRAQAQALCSRLGVRFSALTSSWPPFLVAAASLLKPGGRLSFVVPAEIGHAPYCVPLLDYLAGHFGIVHVVAVKDKLFPGLSEDCWILHAEDFGADTHRLRFTAVDRFEHSAAPPSVFEAIALREWQTVWRRRLRPYLLPAAVRDAYQAGLRGRGVQRFAEVANIGIGYVSGDNDFFHMSPSMARLWDIPESFLLASVRNGRMLGTGLLTSASVEQWYQDDKPVLLLRLPREGQLPASVRRYLDTAEARRAQTAYKCRNRDPWYAVPDVRIPDFFLAYMSGRHPSLVTNAARCTCTNSVHAVRLRTPGATDSIIRAWDAPLARLSCEIEGHPLGGGMLKLEPGEAGRIALPLDSVGDTEHRHCELLSQGVRILQEWRHYAA